MRIELLDAVSVSRSLVALMKEYDEFYWAVAWGRMTDEANELLKCTQKIKCVTFGVSFFHTDPNLIENLQGIEGAYVVTEATGGTFHPKVYCFRSDNKAAAIVGSSNFTFGGLNKNTEASVYVEGLASDPFFKDLFSFTKKSAASGEAITQELANMYRAKVKRAAKETQHPHDPMNGWQHKMPSDFISMDWTEYASEIDTAKYHNVKKSLKLLRIAQKWFASKESFKDFSDEARKAIAGTLAESQKTDSDLNRDWGWFGSMIGAGSFKNRINENDKHLAKALDGIPHKGEVTHKHYNKFVVSFRMAFAESSHMGGVATASRLLAMKRPDVFICICAPNKSEASTRMGFAPSTLDLDNYWDRVIEIVRESVWYNADKPSGFEGRLWESRVAMLDAILYRP